MRAGLTLISQVLVCTSAHRDSESILEENEPVNGCRIGPDLLPSWTPAGGAPVDDAYNLEDNDTGSEKKWADGRRGT